MERPAHDQDPHHTGARCRRRGRGGRVRRQRHPRAGPAAARAAAALEHSKKELACAMAYRASEQRAVDSLEARIAELEDSAVARFKAGRDDLAGEAATVIAATEDERRDRRDGDRPVRCRYRPPAATHRARPQAPARPAPRPRDGARAGGAASSRRQRPPRRRHGHRRVARGGDDARPHQGTPDRRRGHARGAGGTRARGDRPEPRRPPGRCRLRPAPADTAERRAGPPEGQGTAHAAPPSPPQSSRPREEPTP